MRVVMKPVEMVAWFDLQGLPRPVRFRMDGKVIKVEQVQHISEEKLAGNIMKIFQCQSEIGGILRPFELKYELETCKWFLAKI